VPSVRHEAPLELIRQCPPVAAELFRAVTGNDEARLRPESVKVDLGPTDLSDVVPVTFLADSVVVVSDAATREPLVAIIVEPQGRDEPTKKFSWPVYVAVVRRVLRCQYAFLLVVCPDPVEAAKCREVIRTGHPGFDLAPAVIDSGNTLGTGDASPYLTLFAACMGAIDMTDEVGARHVLSAIHDTGAADADRNRLTAIIMNLASDAARQTLEAMMSTIDWTTHPFIESFKKEGIEEGRKEGRQTGLAEGKAEDTLKLIDARGIEVTKEQRGQVTASAGLTKLGKWFDRALTATTAEDIFRD
jgi:hypothetical protein